MNNFKWGTIPTLDMQAERLLTQIELLVNGIDIVCSKLDRIAVAAEDMVVIMGNNDKWFTEEEEE